MGVGGFTEDDDGVARSGWRTSVSRVAFVRLCAACSPVIESSPKSLRSMVGCAADEPAPGDMFADGSFQSSFAVVRASCRS